jgi:hypothetical protein
MIRTQAKRERSVPLGTGPGVFQCFDDCVTVPFLPFWTVVELRYRETEEARRTCQRLRRCLKKSPEQSARALKRCYSTENLMNFLRRHLDLRKPNSVTWDAPVRQEGADLKCRLPDGRWTAVGVENLAAVGAAGWPVLSSVANATRADEVSPDPTPDRSHVHEWRTSVTLPASDFFATLSCD